MPNEDGEFTESNNWHNHQEHARQQIFNPAEQYTSPTSTTPTIDEIKVEFQCKGFNCENKIPSLFDGGICDTCYEKTHTNNPKETCTCQRCENKRLNPQPPTKGKFIVTDPTFIMNSSNWQTKGLKYIDKYIRHENPIPFTTPGNRKIPIKKDGTIISLEKTAAETTITTTYAHHVFYEIKPTQQNHSEYIMIGKNPLKSNCGYLCIAHTDQNWESEPYGFTYDTLEEAKDALNTYINLL